VQITIVPVMSCVDLVRSTTAVSIMINGAATSDGSAVNVIVSQFVLPIVVSLVMSKRGSAAELKLAKARKAKAELEKELEEARQLAESAEQEPELAVVQFCKLCHYPKKRELGHHDLGDGSCQNDPCDAHCKSLEDIKTNCYIYQRTRDLAKVFGHAIPHRKQCLVASRNSLGC